MWLTEDAFFVCSSPAARLGALWTIAVLERQILKGVQVSFCCWGIESLRESLWLGALPGFREAR